MIAGLETDLRKVGKQDMKAFVGVYGLVIDSLAGFSDGAVGVINSIKGSTTQTLCLLRLCSPEPVTERNELMVLFHVELNQMKILFWSITLFPGPLSRLSSILSLANEC